MARSLQAAPAPSRGGREHRKRVTRRDLINAGRKLFGEKGLYESRIEDLTRLAGIAKGTLYGYFANKEELIEAVEMVGFQELVDHVRSRAERAENHRDLIRKVVMAHLKFFDKNPDLVRLFHQIRGMLKFDRREWERLRPGLEKYVNDLAVVLEMRQGPPGRPRKKSRELAEFLFGAISGVTSLRIALARRRRRSHRSAAFVDPLVAVILAHGSCRGERRGVSSTRRRD